MARFIYLLIKSRLVFMRHGQDSGNPFAAAGLFCQYKMIYKLKLKNECTPGIWVLI